MNRRADDRISFRLPGWSSAWASHPRNAAPAALLGIRPRAGTPVRIQRETAVAPPTDRDAALASAWREEWVRLWKRSQLPTKIIEFYDDLLQAESPEKVCAVVREHALRIVGGYRAYVWFPAADAGGEALSAIPYPFHRAGLMHPQDLRDGKTALPGLDPAAPAPEVAVVAYVPFGRRGVLLLTERRSERVFDEDDWEVLCTLADQGDRAIDRVRLLERARELSLTDPLTGLANRRHMEIVLRHAWAAAERGEGLALMMLDLNDFKAINDTHGHATGDEVLGVVANCLCREVRGTDAVVRYGGDEFLVVMPRGDAAGARALAGRIRRVLAGWVGITEGIAVYHPSYKSAEELIRAADEDLYEGKRRRAAATVSD